MANSLLTPLQITREALRMLHQELNFIGSINREYDNSFAQSGGKIGDSLRIRLPNRYVVRNGPTLATQDTTENSITLIISNQVGVDCNFTTAELALSLEDFSTRVLKPQMAVLAANIEADAFNMYLDVWNETRVSGAQTFANLLKARKILIDNLAPRDGPYPFRMNTQDNVDLVDSLKGLFQSSTEISKQYRTGLIGTTGGFEFAENTLLNTYTRGAANGSYVLNGVPAAGATTMTVATGANAMKKGDVFTLASVNRVHPETKVTTGVAHQFVVTADYAGGAGTVSFAPAMYYSGALQNVAAAPASNAAITFAGTASTAAGQSLAYHRDAFTFATADLIDVSQFGAWGSRQTFDGISMRVARQYDINNDRLPCRIDVLYGYKTIRPQLACRVVAN